MNLTNFKFLLIAIIFIISNENVTAQYDTTHYVPPIFAVENVDSHFVYLSTSESLTFPVTIQDGNGNVISTINISQATPQKLFLGQAYAARGPVSRDSLNSILTYDGLIFTASEPFYVNLRHKHSAQGFSLTTKGTQALGTIFRTGHVFNNAQLPQVKGHTISVMATEDNTQITFSDIKSGVVFLNTPTTGTPLTSSPITVTLDKWESYVIGTELDDPLATNNRNNVNGTLIVSNKEIVVNSGSWLGGGHGGGRDIGIDQIVPYQLLGNEYIFVRGNGTQHTERPLVVAIANNTEIYLNNETSPYVTLNTGDYFFIPESKYTAVQNMYIHSNNDFYMYQTLSGSNTAAVGMIFIPPLSCIGGESVTIPEVEQLGSSTISITSVIGSAVYINGSSTPLANPDTVSGNPDWETYRVQSLTGNVTVSSSSKINVALLTTAGARGAAGYFSGFRPSIDMTSNTSNAISFTQPLNNTDTLRLNQSGPFTSITATFLEPQNGGSVTFGTPNQNEIPYTYTPNPYYVGYDYVTIKVCKDFVCANGSTVPNCVNYTISTRIYGPEDCSNGLDDDQDGIDDCNDPDCLPVQSPASIQID